MNALQNTYRSALGMYHAAIGPGGPIAPPGADKFNTLASWVMWGVVLLLVVAAMAAAGKLAYDRQQGTGGDGSAQLGKVAIAAVVVASAVAIVNTLVL
jgi:hypothetical protein